MTEPEGVRPFDWLNALRGAPVYADKSVPPTVLALRSFAPGRPRRRACRAHAGDYDADCPGCLALDWVFFVSHEQLAEDVQSSPRTMERGTRALRVSGHLDLVRRGSGGHDAKANEYRLALPASPAKLADEEPS